MTPRPVGGIATKILLIGQAPGPNTDPKRPLAPLPKTSAGGRLAELAGLDAVSYLRTFDTANLLYEFPGRWKRDDKFPLDAATIAANAMKPLLRKRRIVLIGRRVALAFGFPKEAEFHCWYHDQWWDYEVAVAPHTSGRNHWYRKEGNLEKSFAFWRSISL